MRRRDDLSTPRGGLRFGVHYDPEAFGILSEGIARFLGTARYLVFQTVVVTVWIIYNSAAGDRAAFDPYPFILLTLALSLQASYAAPLILLAQNRQAEREREGMERDREMNARSLADTEFLARELAAIRIALQDVVTNSDLDRRIERLVESLGPPDEDPDPAPA